MEISNNSICSVSQFYLICFPELNSSRYLLSLPLTVLMLLSLVANSIIIITMYAAPGLKQPKYYLLSVLAVVDFLLCVVSTPKTLAILWFNDNSVTSATCFTQMYFIISYVGMESALFLILAFDRYIYICHPLRYPSIITKRLVVKSTFFMMGRNLIVSLPLPFLAAHRNYCASNAIMHCFCSTQAEVSISSSDSTVISLYRLSVISILLGTDLLFILFSYYMIIQAVLRLDNLRSALKTFCTCSSHLILILFFYSTVITITVSNLSGLPFPHVIYVLLSVLHHLVPPALNPIVYGLRAKEIQQALRKLLGRHNAILTLGW